MNRLAAAILAYAANDLLSGRDTEEILTWIDGAPAQGHRAALRLLCRRMWAA